MKSFVKASARLQQVRLKAFIWKLRLKADWSFWFEACNEYSYAYFKYFHILNSSKRSKLMNSTSPMSFLAIKPFFFFCTSKSFLSFQSLSLFLSHNTSQGEPDNNQKFPFILILSPQSAEMRSIQREWIEWNEPIQVNVRSSKMQEWL